MSEVTYSPSQTGEQASSATETVKEKAREATGQAQEKAHDLKTEAGERVRNQVDSRSTQAGDQVTSVAETLRKTGEQLRGEGKDSHARMADQAAGAVERVGSYLKEADSARLLRDVEAFGRRRPWALALAGGVVGLLGARFLKSSSSGRYQQSVEPASTRRDRAPLPAGETAAVTPPYQEL